MARDNVHIPVGRADSLFTSDFGRRADSCLPFSVSFTLRPAVEFQTAPVSPEKFYVVEVCR